MREETNLLYLYNNTDDFEKEGHLGVWYLKVIIVTLTENPLSLKVCHFNSYTLLRIVIGLELKAVITSTYPVSMSQDAEPRVLIWLAKNKIIN